MRTVEPRGAGPGRSPRSRPRAARGARFGILLAVALAALGSCGDGDREARVREIHALADSGAYVEALPALEALADGAAATPDLLHLRARILAGLGRFAEADSAATEAVTQAPDSAAYRRTLGGIAYERSGEAMQTSDLDGTLAHLERAVEHAPDSRVFVRLGTVLNQAGDNEGALRAFRRAVELQPDAAPLRFNVALALVRLNRIEEAEQELRWALETDPNPDLRARINELLGLLRMSAR